MGFGNFRGFQTPLGPYRVCALIAFIPRYLEHLVDSLSCLCRCLKVKEAPALCPQPPLAFIHAPVLGAVDLEGEKRQRSEPGRGLQRQLDEHSCEDNYLMMIWLEKLIFYPEGMEAAEKESRESKNKKACESSHSTEIT